MKEQKFQNILSVAGTQTRLESFAKYAGLATVAVEWSALTIYYLKAPLYLDGRHPISFFATLDETRWAFTVCYVLAAIFYWIFTKHHLAKYYKMPLKIFGISLLLFAATGLFPYDPENTVSLIIHTAMALSSSLLFAIGMYLFAKHASDKLLSNMTLTAIVFSVSLIIAFLLSPAESNLIFAFEAGSWFVIQLWVIWVSFYVHKRKRLE